MTDSSDWKIVRLSTLIPIRSHVNRHLSVVVHLGENDEFVTDKCSLSLTERNRRNFGFYIKPIRDFKKIKNRPIKSTPGLCGFWKGYRRPSIKVGRFLQNFFELCCCFLFGSGVIHYSLLKFLRHSFFRKILYSEYSNAKQSLCIFFFKPLFIIHYSGPLEF